MPMLKYNRWSAEAATLLHIAARFRRTLKLKEGSYVR
jgi:hypothetical protein